MELIKVGEKTYYIKNPTNIGIYKIDDDNVCLIDSGNDKEAGRKILKIINENNWKVKKIISTHSHADHIGGNNFIQNKTGCDVLALKSEAAFISYPFLEPSFLYGGSPLKDLENKFLKAKESSVKSIENSLPDGLEYFNLKGHSYDMIGIKTSDDVYFLADSLASMESINKYHVFFIYDVKKYLESLEFLSNLNGKLYIPSHCFATDNISDLIKINKDKIYEICNAICEFCSDYKTFEDILKYVFDRYDLAINTNEYYLVGSTIRSYLSFLYNDNKITFIFKDNKMFWKKTN